MLEFLAKRRKSVWGDGPLPTEGSPLPEFDRWREILEETNAQIVAAPLGDVLPDQDGRKEGYPQA
eukprot:865360-Alexandrium_andersonii.AAC.1